MVTNDDTNVLRPTVQRGESESKEGEAYQVGSCLRLIDSSITQLNAQGPRTCNKSKEEMKKKKKKKVSSLLPY